MNKDDLMIRKNDLTRIVDTFLAHGEAPPKEICNALDQVLEQIIFSPEVELGPNVLLFDQNLRRKTLVNRKYSQNAKVLEFKARVK